MPISVLYILYIGKQQYQYIYFVILETHYLFAFCVTYKNKNIYRAATIPRIWHQFTRYIITLGSDEKKKCETSDELRGQLSACISTVEKSLKGAHLVDDVAIDETPSSFTDYERTWVMLRVIFIDLERDFIERQFGGKACVYYEPRVSLHARMHARIYIHRSLIEANNAVDITSLVQ